MVRCGTVAGVPKTWRKTELWRDLTEVPEALRQTLDAADGFDAAADALRGATRVIATGNGAAYYVAQALWLASLDGTGGAPVVAVPGGLVAGGRFNWRPGDRLLAISSSGEFRDVIDAVEQGAPRPVACVTAKPGSSLGKLRRRPRRPDGAQPARAHAHAGLLRRRCDGARGVGARHGATTPSRPSWPERRRRSSGPSRRPSGSWSRTPRTRSRAPRSCSAPARPGRRRSRARCS